MPFVYTFRINIAIFADINAYTSHEKKTVRFKLCHALQTIDNIVSVFVSADILPRYLFHCHEWWQNSFPISIAFLLLSSASFPVLIQSDTHSNTSYTYVHTHARTHTVGCPAAIFERFIMYFGQMICLHTIGKINSHYRNYSKPPPKHAQLTHIDVTQILDTILTETNMQNNSHSAIKHPTILESNWTEWHSSIPNWQLSTWISIFVRAPFQRYDGIDFVFSFILVALWMWCVGTIPTDTIMNLLEIWHDKST